MKKNYIFSVLAILIHVSTFCQNPVFELRDGLTMNVLLKTWENTLITDPKFSKAKQEVKDELMAVRNEDIVSRKTGSERIPYTYKITKESSGAGTDHFKTAWRSAGRELSNHLYNTKDTLFIYRSRGVTPLDNDGANQGFNFMEVVKIPFNIKLGDVLPVYEDLSVSYPPTKKLPVKEWENTGGGNWIYTPLQQVDAEVLRAATITSQSLYHVDAKIGRTEEFAIEKKLYNAFVIESETWEKTKTGETFEASRKGKATLQSKTGYIVSYREEWFVPELGIVKTRIYDSYGGIVSETLIVSML